MRTLLFFLPLLVFLFPLPCVADPMFTNPGGNAADPMILRKPTGEAVKVDGRFWLYFTGNRTLYARSTTDFVEWREEGIIFRGEGTWARSALWAPEVYAINNRFYLFFSAQNSDLEWTVTELFNIGVAVADHPRGPFKLLIDRPIFEPGYPIIDANLFIDTDGTPYLTYSRCCYKHPVESELSALAKREGWFEEIEESWIYGVQLMPCFTGIVGEPVLLLRPPVTLDDPQTEWESRSVTAREVNRRWTEGSTLFKYRDTYYLMYSANYFGGDYYATGYATSDKPLGPFAKAANNPVLEKNTPAGTVRGTGHNNIFFWPDERMMYTVYHGRTEGNARRLFIDRMEIDAEGVLHIHGPTTTPQSIPVTACQVIRADGGNGWLIVENKADPWVVRDGDRYIWCFTRNDRGVDLFVSDTPLRLGTRHPIWTAPERGPYSREVWAPELHRIGDHWYVYFAASDGRNENHLTYVLKSATCDPLSEYSLLGPLMTGDCLEDPAANRWAIDMMPFEHNGELYTIWSGWQNSHVDIGVQAADVQHLFIAKMENPWTVATPRVRIANNDDYLWERTYGTLESRGLAEGSAIIRHKDRVFLIYSTGASWLETYKLGLLELVGDDPLDPNSWQKHPEPVFTSANNPEGRTFGVGHVSFLLCGPEPLIFYHTKRERRPGWLRDSYVRTFHFDETGFPVFGVKE